MALDVRTHSLGIRNQPFPFFDEIAKGKKTVEVRYLSRYIDGIRTGDFILFKMDSKCAKCKVTDKRVYHTYKQLLEAEGLDHVIPGIKKIEEALKIYATFPCFNYVKENGPPKVAAFEVELLEVTDVRPSKSYAPHRRHHSSRSRATTPYSRSSGKFGNDE